MQTVHKFRISFERDERVLMPDNAKIVLVGLDNAPQPCIWALVEVGQSKTRERKFGIYGTGGQVPDFCEHVGSFITKPGTAETGVWHVFEENRT